MDRSNGACFWARKQIRWIHTKQIHITTYLPPEVPTLHGYHHRPRSQSLRVLRWTVKGGSANGKTLCMQTTLQILRIPRCLLHAVAPQELHTDC